jgi:SAM-dependent methyltransferase
MSAEAHPQGHYDQLGVRYTANRQADPRLARRILAALGEAKSILNVGAGTGAYEPCERDVLAVEPSQVMRAQRRSDAAPCIDASAESLPLPDDSFDAAMALLSLHHWRDWLSGVHEMRRVARRRIVIFTYDPACLDGLWLTRDYLPELLALDVRRFPPLDEQARAAGPLTRIEPLPIPHDCVDGFLGAYWRRPHAYLDPEIRAGMSTFHLPGAETLLGGLEELATDLQSGRWQQRNHDILERTEIDLGYRLLISEL